MGPRLRLDVAAPLHTACPALRRHFDDAEAIDHSTEPPALRCVCGVVIGRLSQAYDVRTLTRRPMADALASLERHGPATGLSHFDADRLGAAAILVRPLRRPGSADGRYGSGPSQATGGALPTRTWNEFIAGLGLPQARVEA